MNLVAWARDLSKKKGIEPPRLVLDLDAVMTETLEFQIQGERHQIAPVSTSQFVEVVEAFSVLDALIKKNQVTADEMIEAYTRCFSTLSPSITRKHVEGMTQKQCGMLWQLMLDCVTGKAYTQDTLVKKKVETEAVAPN